MKKPSDISVLAGLIVFLFLSTFFFSPLVATANGALSASDQTRRIIYEGLEISNAGECKGGLKIQVPGYSGRTFCTPGPDAITDFVASARRPGLSAATAAQPNNDPALSTAVCDSDGITGNRVQVLYAHASDVPSQYASKLASFQQWAVEMDSIFGDSAVSTGGYRRVRFVTDPNCKPVVTEVTLSTTGDDTFGRTVGELLAQGYNRTDRKYLVFVDARVYCGIANIEFDDQPDQANANNVGPHFARVDAGCWSGVIAAHELMHTLGGVQLTAPNSDGNFHCNDGYDIMCNRSGHAVAVVCPDLVNGSLFDCEHDDYFNTNPAAGSYLATFWNTANSKFLINTPSIMPAPSVGNTKILIPLITMSK